MASICPKRGAKPRSIGSLFLVLCALTPILAACATSRAGPANVSLVPIPNATSQAWKWSAGCPFGPGTHNACRSAGPTLGPAQLEGDEWNLGRVQKAGGSLGMSVSSSGAVALNADFSTTPPCTTSGCLAPNAFTWVRGFPSVLYGVNLCHGTTSPRVSKLLPLPMRVDSIPADLIGTTAYSLQSPRATYDIAYDMWLNRSSTKRPCMKNGTLEVMVWTAYNHPAQLPGSMEVAAASIPFAVNGVAKSGKQAWGVFTSNVYGAGRTAPWGGTVWFVLNAADVVDKGSVSVNLSSVLSAVAGLLQENYGWHNFGENYWLDTIPFGMEFGPQDGSVTGSGASHFSLKLSAFCLQPGTTLQHAAACQGS